MELNEFIKQTIIQITDGVRDGNKYIQENDFGEGVRNGYYKEVNFDIAVTSNEEEKSGMGGKISVANLLSLGANDESKTKYSNVSRIQFSVTLGIKTDL